MNAAIRILLATACLLWIARAPAQDLFIRGASAPAMGGAGEAIDVLVVDGLIQAAGPGLPAPASDMPVLEAEGRVLTPGLFAGLSSLGLEEVSIETATVDNVFSGAAQPRLGRFRPEFDLRPAYNPHSSLVPITRIEGYTWTVLAARRGDSIVAGQGRAVSLSGDHADFMGEPVLFIDVGADAAGTSGESRAAQWMLLEQLMDESDKPGDYHGLALLTPLGRGALGRFRGDGLVVFGVDRASDILQVLTFAKRHRLRPVIAGGAEAWMVREQLAAAQVPVLVDPLLNLPASFDHLGARMDNAALLHAGGVPIAFSQTPDMESHNARRLRQLAGNAVANGLPYDAAIAALTANPARIFGTAREVGGLQPGQRADLVLWSGDPLEVTSVAEQVVIGGVPDPMISRQTLLRDRYLPQNSELPRAYTKP